MPKYVLGISCFYHDASACLLRDGQIVAAASEERFTRKKHDDNFPINAVTYCLNSQNIEISDVTGVAFYEKPIIKFERILREFILNWPRNIKQFYRFMPTWIGKKLFMGNLIAKELKVFCTKKEDTIPPIYFVPHHVSHAASAFFTSSLQNATILTLDGVGEDTTTAIFKGEGNTITPLQHITYPDSLGLLYSAFTYYLGFKVNSGEYKMMGLSPYGEAKHVDTVKKVVEIYEDGSFKLHQKYFAYRWGETMTSKAFAKLFGKPRREPEEPLTQFHKDLAASIQRVTEEIIEKMVRHSRSLNNSPNLCLGGGVALNCVANGKLLKSQIYDHISLFPGCGDDGGAVGAALYLQSRLPSNTNLSKPVPTPYLGPGFKNIEIEGFLREHHIPFHHKDEAELCQTLATEINQNNAIVGHFDGRMEFGPRALGNRSIIADPRKEENWKRVNLQIKFRESFRPFAPAVLEEKCSEVFDLDVPSPYMLLVSQVKKEGLPAITHVDNSARVQSVSQTDNPRFHGIIKAFDAQTGTPVLINTSFNVRGEPIVCDYIDAWKCFLHTGIDILVLNDFLIYATDLDKEKFKTHFPIQEFEAD